jgi:hypothetical protein
VDVGSLTDEGLAEIDDLLDSATPGPWYVRLLDDDFSMNIVAVSTVSGEGAPGSFPDFNRSEIVAATLVQHPGYVNIEDGRWDENANFIAVARDLVPQLLAEVRRLRKIVSDCGEVHL